MSETRANLRSPRALAQALGVGQWLRLLRGKPLSPAKKRPTDLIYGVEDVPPPLILFFVGMQHVSLIRIQLIYPLFVIQMAELPTTASVNMLGLALLALGAAAILQSLPKGPIGSGLLCPPCHTGIFLEPSIAALKLGGLPLVFGMTIFAGLIQSVLAPSLRRLRPLLPPEIGGLVVFFVGTSVAAIGCRYMLGVGARNPVGSEYWLVGAFTLMITIALNVWGKGQARLFCAMIGIIAGYGAAMFTGLLPTEAFHDLHELPLLALPSLAHGGWSFSPTMILPFTVAALAITLKGIGDITACQRINDAGWIRPDMGSISRGTLANGLGNMFAGLLGTCGLTPSTASIGLQSATSVSSRVIGFAVGGILIVLAFLPSVTGTLILMPRPVMGASLVFSSCFVLISGLQTITSRMLDARRTIVIGLAIASAVAAEIIPDFARNIPPALEPVVSSSIVLGTVTALLLNGLFRLGQKQRLTLALDPVAEDAHAQVDEFFETAGRQWGARPDVMVRAAFGINQAIETVREHCEPQGPVLVEAHFDEFDLGVKIGYRGQPLELPERRPSDREIIETEAGYRQLAGFMLRRNADRVRTSVSDGSCALEFHFEH
ncbi:MAG TPA: solute carrier family 23 protein [Xanthobacteraceae bacterium]